MADQLNVPSPPPQHAAEEHNDAADLFLLQQRPPQRCSIYCMCGTRIRLKVSVNEFGCRVFCDTCRRAYLCKFAGWKRPTHPVPDAGVDEIANLVWRCSCPKIHAVSCAVERLKVGARCIDCRKIFRNPPLGAVPVPIPVPPLVQAARSFCPVIGRMHQIRVSAGNVGVKFRCCHCGIKQIFAFKEQQQPLPQLGN